MPLLVCRTIAFHFWRSATGWRSRNPVHLPPSFWRSTSRVTTRATCPAYCWKSPCSNRLIGVAGTPTATYCLARRSATALTRRSYRKLWPRSSQPNKRRRKRKQHLTKARPEQQQYSDYGRRLWLPPLFLACPNRCQCRAADRLSIEALFLSAPFEPHYAFAIWQHD